jgi:hypothetical protein
MVGQNKNIYVIISSLIYGVKFGLFLKGFFMQIFEKGRKLSADLFKFFLSTNL